MPFQPDNMTLDTFKGCVDRLQRYAKQNPGEIQKRAWCQEAMARAFGFEHYHAAQAALKRPYKMQTPSKLTLTLRQELADPALWTTELKALFFSSFFPYEHNDSLKEHSQYRISSSLSDVEIGNLLKQSQEHRLPLLVLDEIHDENTQISGYSSPFLLCFLDNGAHSVERIIKGFLETEMNIEDRLKSKYYSEFFTAMLCMISWSKELSLDYFTLNPISFANDKIHGFLMSLKTASKSSLSDINFYSEFYMQQQLEFFQRQIQQKYLQPNQENAYLTYHLAKRFLASIRMADANGSWDDDALRTWISSNQAPAMQLHLSMRTSRRHSDSAKSALGLGAENILRFWLRAYPGGLVIQNRRFENNLGPILNTGPNIYQNVYAEHDRPHLIAKDWILAQS